MPNLSHMICEQPITKYSRIDGDAYLFPKLHQHPDQHRFLNWSERPLTVMHSIEVASASSHCYAQPVKWSERPLTIMHSQWSGQSVNSLLCTVSEVVRASSHCYAQPVKWPERPLIVCVMHSQCSELNSWEGFEVSAKLVKECYTLAPTGVITKRSILWRLTLFTLSTTLIKQCCHH